MLLKSSGRFGGRAAILTLLLVSALSPGLALADLNEEQELTPTANALAAAGTSSAIFGDTAVVGAPNDTGDVVTCAVGAGAAYVYTRSGTLWTKVATLCASDGALGDRFGASVSINSGNIAVGAPSRAAGAGAVYVYSGGGATWTENGTILTSAQTTANGGAGQLGSAVSIQGFTVAAGAPHSKLNGKADAGITVVFTSNDSGNTWTTTTFRANGGQARAGGLFGTSVSLSGSTILVGAPGYTTGHPHSGTVFVFVNNGAVWTQQANIRPANTTNAFTGTAVSLFQDTAAFGAPGAGSGKGAVYVYQRTGTTWTSQASITVPGSANGDNFGASVSIEGTPASYLAAGAPFANSTAGTAYQYFSSGGAFSLTDQLVATDNAATDNFGSSLSLDSGRILVGAPGKNISVGASYVFKFLAESVTAITGFSTDPDPSLTGVPYTVTVTVTDGTGGTGTPTGSVHLDDSNGGTCDATLSASGDPDGHAVGSCQLTSSFFGTLTMNASYGGDGSFAPSSASVPHDVTGNHLAFVPSPPPDVLQGNAVAGLTVQVLDGSNALITSDSTTQVTLTVDDSCGNTDSIGTLTVTNGVADFSGVGPKFYTLATGLSVHAVSSNATTAANDNINVVANTDFVFADGFEDCRL
jgi:hypothetical protein